MKSTLEFTHETGVNCLMVSFQQMCRYINKTGQYPTSSTGMFTEIETTILFLIEQGEKHGVDMSTILNTRNKGGETLFYWATMYSEKIALTLLESNVIVTTITSNFNTPWFKVS